MQRIALAPAVAALAALTLAACGSGGGSGPLTAREIATKLDCTGISQGSYLMGQYLKDDIECYQPQFQGNDGDSTEIYTFSSMSSETAWLHDPNNGGQIVEGHLWVIGLPPDASSYPALEPWVAHVRKVLGPVKEMTAGY